EGRGEDEVVDGLEGAHETGRWRRGSVRGGRIAPGVVGLVAGLRTLGEADAFDDDVHLGHVFAGHGHDLFADGELHVVGGAADFGAVGDDEADLDGVGVLVVLADAHAAVIGFALGEDLADAVNNAAADAGHALDLQGGEAHDAGDDVVVDLDVAEVGLVVETGRGIKVGRLHGLRVWWGD